MRGYLHKYLLLLLIVCIAINGIFFLLRNNTKFTYTNYSSIDELYTAKTDKDIQKWAYYNNRFTEEEIKTGTEILNKQIRIDTVLGEYEKAAAIAKWLKKSFKGQEGYPAAALGTLSPLDQYKLLSTKKSEKLWCSHYQAMLGFYCTLAGIKNRYVEAVPVQGDQKAGYHEVNEIYLPSSQQWVMVDVTRNILFVKQQQKMLTAAEYYSQLVSGIKTTVTYQRYEYSTASLTDSMVVAPADVYFNSHYALRYYYTMDLKTVYSAKNKAKRFFFGNPWFEMYDPIRPHNNFFFRARQLAVLMLLLSVLSVIYFLGVKKALTRRADHSQNSPSS